MDIKHRQQTSKRYLICDRVKPSTDSVLASLGYPCDLRAQRENRVPMSPFLNARLGGSSKS